MDNGAENYKRYLEGNDEGLVEIIREYKDGLILFLNRYVNHIEVAEELAEDTFVCLFTKRPHFHPKASFKTWLYTIGRNLAVSYLRKQARHKTVWIEEEKEVLQKQEEELLEQKFLKEESRIRIHKILASIPPDYGRILYLKYFEEMSNEEMAYVLKKTKRQVENLLYQAKLAARKSLEKEGFVDEELF